MTSLTRSFTLPHPCDDAWALFTATGERLWVPGWEPSFPDGQDDRVPGTVFTTRHDEHVTTWIVTAVEPGRRIAYARVTPNDTAGTVVVTCCASSGGDTEVTVKYELTALTPKAAARLSAFADGYHRYIDSWQRAILEFTTRHPAEWVLSLRPSDSDSDGHAYQPTA